MKCAREKREWGQMQSFGTITSTDSILLSPYGFNLCFRIKETIWGDLLFVLFSIELRCYKFALLSLLQKKETQRIIFRIEWNCKQKFQIFCIPFLVPYHSLQKDPEDDLTVFSHSVLEQEARKWLLYFGFTSSHLSLSLRKILAQFLPRVLGSIQQKLEKCSKMFSE